MYKATGKVERNMFEKANEYAKNSKTKSSLDNVDQELGIKSEQLYCIDRIFANII